MKKLLTKLVSLALLGSFFVPPQPVEAKRIYYDNSSTQWSSVRVNSWGGTNPVSSAVMTSDGNNRFYYDVNDEFKPENLEFHDANDYNSRTEKINSSSFNIPANTVFKGLNNGSSTKLIVLPTDNKLYLVGQVNGNGWTPANAIPMETSDGLVYKKTVKFDSEGQFSLITVQGDWTTDVNNNIRYHSGGSGHKGINSGSPAD